MNRYENLIPGRIYLFLPEGSARKNGEQLFGLFEGNKNGWPQMKAIMFNQNHFLHDLPLPAGYRCVREAAYEEICDFCFRHGFALHRQMCLSEGKISCTLYRHWVPDE